MSEPLKSEKVDTAGRADRIIDAEVEPVKATVSTGRKVLRVLRLLLIAVFISVALAAGYHFYTQMLQARSAPPPVAIAPAAAPSPSAAMIADAAQTRRIDDLERRLAALAGGLERLRDVGAAPAGADPGQIDTRLAELESRIAAQIADQQQKSGQRVDGLGRDLAREQSRAVDRLNELEGRLAELAAAKQADLRRPVAILLAWMLVRDRAVSGQTFTAEAAALQRLLTRENSGPLLEALSPVMAFAAAGAPTPASLVARFPAIAEAQQRDPAAQTADGGQPWWQRLLHRLSSLITIRRVGGETGGTDEPAARLAQAEAALAQSDLTAAIEALTPLTAGADLQGWREAAQARLALQAALERFSAALRDHFGTGG